MSVYDIITSGPDLGKRRKIIINNMTSPGSNAETVFQDIC